MSAATAATTAPSKSSLVVASDIIDRYITALERLKGQERRVLDVDVSLSTLRIHISPGDAKDEQSIDVSDALAQFDRVLERERAELKARVTEFEVVDAERIKSKGALKDAMQSALDAFGLLLSVEPIISVTADETSVCTKVAKVTTDGSLASSLQIRADPPIAGVFKDGYRSTLDHEAEGATDASFSSNLRPIYVSANGGAMLDEAFTVISTKPTQG